MEEKGKYIISIGDKVIGESQPVSFPSLTERGLDSNGQPIDFKALLVKYMAHILECGEYDPLLSLNNTVFSKVKFTAEEEQILQGVSVLAHRMTGRD